MRSKIIIEKKNVMNHQELSWPTSYGACEASSTVTLRNITSTAYVVMHGLESYPILSLEKLEGPKRESQKKCMWCKYLGDAHGFWCETFGNYLRT